jgi:hypothetical protein
MADRPKRPPTGSNDPFRNTRPRIAPPPPLPPRPAYRTKPGLDDKQAEMVRAYVKGEELPDSEPPPSDPEPSFATSTREDFDSSEPPAPSRRMVELTPDMTIRPRRSWPRAVKDWAETLSHAQKIIIGIGAIGSAAWATGTALYKAADATYDWVQTRASSADVAVAVETCVNINKKKADQIALEDLRAEIGDAGARLGETWDKQDEINAHVHKELTRIRPQTPPASLGPKAKAAGKH